MVTPCPIATISQRRCQSTPQGWYRRGRRVVEWMRFVHWTCIWPRAEKLLVDVEVCINPSHYNCWAGTDRKSIDVWKWIKSIGRGGCGPNDRFQLKVTAKVFLKRPSSRRAWVGAIVRSRCAHGGTIREFKPPLHRMIWRWQGAKSGPHASWSPRANKGPIKLRF